MQQSVAFLFSIILIISAGWDVPVYGITVWGKVTYGDDTPVSGALVTFIDEGDTTRVFSDPTDEHGMYEVVLEGATEVVSDLGEQILSEDYALYPSYPNPFNPSAVISFGLGRQSYVRVRIYNVVGQPVRMLVDGHRSAGVHRILWDGRDDTDIALGAGVYICRMEADGHVRTRRMVMLDSRVGGRLSDREGAPSVFGSMKTAEGRSYTVSITGEGILSFLQSGIPVPRDTRLDFVVERISTEEPPMGNLADVISVDATGNPGAYMFRVGIASPDEGCHQYADWWEILSEEGNLMYRRILLHSHVNEQPFVRSGGPVAIGADEIVWVRVHMHPDGYGGRAFKGSVQSGFQPAELGAEFAAELAEVPPLPEGCTF